MTIRLLFILLILSYFTVIALFVEPRIFTLNPLLVPLVMCFVLSLLSISTQIVQCKPDFGTILVWSYVAWNFTLPGITQYHDGYYWYLIELPASERYVFEAGFLLLLFCVSFVFASAMWRTVPAREAEARFQETMGVVRLSSFVGCILALLIIYKYGARPFFLAREPFGEYIWTHFPGGGYVYQSASSVLLIIFAYSVLVIRAANQRGSVGMSIILVTLILGASNILINNPFHAARFVAVCFLVVLISTLFFSNRDKLLRVYVICYPILAYFVSPVISFINRTGEHSLSDLQDLHLELISGDFAELQMAMMAIYYVESEGLRWGSHLLAALLFFIPRSWWPGKGLSGGEQVAQMANQSFTNLSIPSFAEFYMDFGLIGVVCFAVALSFLIKKAFNFARYRSPLSHGYMMTAIVVGFMPIIMRGALLAVAGQMMAVMIMPIALALLGRLLSTKSGSPEAGSWTTAGTKRTGLPEGSRPTSGPERRC